MLAAEAFSCLIKYLMSEWMRSVACSSTTLASYLAADRFSALPGATPPVGSSNIGSMTRQ